MHVRDMITRSLLAGLFCLILVMAFAVEMVRESTSPNSLAIVYAADRATEYLASHRIAGRYPEKIADELNDSEVRYVDSLPGPNAGPGIYYQPIEQGRGYRMVCVGTKPARVTIEKAP